MTRTSTTKIRIPIRSGWWRSRNTQTSPWSGTKSDLALLEKLKRKLNAARITDEFEKLLSSPAPEDHTRLVTILSAFEGSVVGKLVSEETRAQVTKAVYKHVAPSRKSSDESSALKYLKTVGPMLNTLDQGGILKREDFLEYLVDLLRSSKTSPALKNKISSEWVLGAWPLGSDYIKRYRSALPEDLPRVLSTWIESPDPRKVKFAIAINQCVSKALAGEEPLKALNELFSIGIVDLQYRNVSGFSLLALADYYEQPAVVDWLIKNSEELAAEAKQLRAPRLDQKKSGRICLVQ